MVGLSLVYFGGVLVASLATYAWVKSLKKVNRLQRQYISELEDESTRLKLVAKKSKEHLNNFKKEVQGKAKLSENSKKSENNEKQLLKGKISELEGILHDKNSEIQQYEMKLDHFKAQTDAMVGQLTEIEQHKKSEILKLNTLISESEKESAAKLDSVKMKLSDAHSESRDLERRLKVSENNLKSARNKLKVSDPKLVEAAKSKVNHYRHLYNIMKSQKELLEERNANWELALKLLSTWVLKQTSNNTKIPSSLGELVAAALETSKSGPLIDPKDDFSEEYRVELEEIKKERSAAHFKDAAETVMNQELQSSTSEN